MLQGSLKEAQYDWPTKELLEAGKASPLKSQGVTSFARDEVTYIADSVSPKQSKSDDNELMLEIAWPPQDFESPSNRICCVITLYVCFNVGLRIPNDNISSVHSCQCRKARLPSL